MAVMEASNRRSIRVALIAHDPVARNRRVVQMAEGLAADGYEVCLYVGHDLNWPDGPPVSLSVERCLPTEPEQADDGAIDRLIEAQQPHIVQVNDPVTLARMARVLPATTRLIYDAPGAGQEPLNTVETEPLTQWAGNWWRRLQVGVGERRAAPRVDAVLCSSYLFGEFLQRELKLAEVPVVPIYAALPHQELPRPAAPWLLTGRPAVVVLAPEFAALEVSLTAVAQLRKVELVVINGRGDPAPLQAWAKQHEMTGRLHRLQVDEADLPGALAAARAGLSLSRDHCQRALYDIPDSLFHYLMAGIPVVASWLPGLERIIHQSHFGVLANPDDPAHLADQLARICLDDAAAERFCHNVKVVRKSRYSWEVQQRRLNQLYAQMCGHSSTVVPPQENRQMAAG